MGKCNGIKSELYISTAWALLTSTHTITAQSESGKLSLAASVLVNQTVGGKVLGQQITIAHTSKGLRLSLVWVRHVPKSILFPSPFQKSESSRPIPKSHLTRSSPLLDIKGLIYHRHVLSQHMVPRNILIYLLSRRKEIPHADCILRELTDRPHEWWWHNLSSKY